MGVLSPVNRGIVTALATQIAVEQIVVCVIENPLQIV